MKKIGENILYKGNWLALKEDIYLSNNGKEVRWETIARTKQNKAVIIIAYMPKSDRYILIKQFRQALNNYVIGMPAGLIDNDDVEGTALKELKEETGYYGKITSISPLLRSNPALSTDCARIVNMEVDEADERNLNPTQRLEEEEEIEVCLVKRDEVKEFLIKEEKKGSDIGMGTWYAFAVSK